MRVFSSAKGGMAFIYNRLEKDPLSFDVRNSLVFVDFAVAQSVVECVML
jgi:hypothetical protein